MLIVTQIQFICKVMQLALQAVMYCGFAAKRCVSLTCRRHASSAEQHHVRSTHHLPDKANIIQKGPARRETPAPQAASSPTAASQQYPSRTSRLKTIHRIVFFTPLTPSVFESLVRKNAQSTKVLAHFFGPPEGIRTPTLQNRNLLHYPIMLQADYFVFLRLFFFFSGSG